MICLSHSSRTRAALAALLAALIGLAPALAPPVRAQGSDANTAVAVNDKDGSSVFDVAFQIRRVSSGVVDQTNVAAAYASCESCQTVAIAIQIVLVSGEASTVAPTNLAIAINESCTTCQTMALAYQFVFGSGDVIGFTPEGQKRLNEIRKELSGLSRLGLTNAEISARVLELTDQIRDLLATEVVIRGQDDRPDEQAGGEDGAPDPGAEDPAVEDDPDAGGPNGEDPAPDEEAGAAPDQGEPLPEEEPTDEPQEPLPPEDAPDDAGSQEPPEEPVPPADPAGQ